VLELANIKSAKKRILVSRKKAMRNKALRSKVKTVIKKVDAAVAENNKESASSALKVAVAEIDRAARKGIFHKNTAARKKSRLALAVNRIA
jgi:small subunit ribosomal protein S20